MDSQLLSEALEVVSDEATLINLVSRRLRQLNSGSPALVILKPGASLADIALQETIEGKIRPEAEPVQNVLEIE